MAMRLVALDDGPDIPVERAVVVVGRHPHCDARIDSIRISRRHCCMTVNGGEVIVRDLGSTNGIRINGHRVEEGRLRPGDELSIAHIRYRLDGTPEIEATLADAPPESSHNMIAALPGSAPPAKGGAPENPLAAAVRELLPANLADHCRIQVIVQMQPEATLPQKAADACPHDSSP